MELTLVVPHPEAVPRIRARFPAQVVVAPAAEGLRRAQGKRVAVVDRDDPEWLAALLAQDADVAVAAGAGGLRARAAHWAVPAVRAACLGDPGSTFFVVRRSAIDAAALPKDALLGILAQRPGRVVEVPRPRPLAESEADLGRHTRPSRSDAPAWKTILGLAWRDVENLRMARFALVGLSGVLVNLGLLLLLHERLRLHDLIAVPIAVEASIVWNHFWNDHFTFRDRRRSHYLMRLVRFNAVSLAALVVNVLVYAVLTRGFGTHFLAAEAVAIVVAFGLNYLGNFHWTYGRDTPRLRPAARRMLPWLPFVLVVATAGAMYFDNLGYVDGMTFDEHYYVVVAYQLRNGVWEDPCWIGAEIDHRPLNYEHPPLAKYIIAASVQAFSKTDAELVGCREQGNAAYRAFETDLRAEEPWIWRAPSAVFGTATVAFAGLAAARLVGWRTTPRFHLIDAPTRLPGGVASTGQARDPGSGDLDSDLDSDSRAGRAAPRAVRADAPDANAPVQTGAGGPPILRDAMPPRAAPVRDSVAPAALAAFAGALLVLSDGTVFTASRMAILDIYAAAFTVAAVFFATFPSTRGRVASMVSLALGFSCKYSVAFAGPAVLAVALWAQHREHGVRGKDALRAAGAYIATAGATWFALYIPWLRMWSAQGGVGYALRHLFELTVEGLRWQAAGQQTHDYISPPGEWLMLRRPTLIFYDRAVGGDDSMVRYIYSIGNPALYWLAIIVFVVAWWPAIWLTIRPRGQRGDLRRWWHALGRGGQATAVAALLPATVYGAFFLLTRSTYAFYMGLVAPLMAVAVATAMGASWRRRTVAAAWTLPALILAWSWFVHYFPVLSAQVIERVQFDAIMANWPWMRP